MVDTPRRPKKASPSKKYDGPKNVRLKDCVNDPMYVDIRDLALDKITGPTCAFAFEDVIEELNIRAHWRGISFTRVVKQMVEAEGAELFPATKAFFKKRKNEHDMLTSSQIAGSAGTTYGFVNVCGETEGLYLHRLQIMKNQQDGKGEAVKRSAQIAIEKGVDADKVQNITGPLTPRIVDQTDGSEDTDEDDEDAA